MEDDDFKYQEWKRELERRRLKARQWIGTANRSREQLMDAWAGLLAATSMAEDEQKQHISELESVVATLRNFRAAVDHSEALGLAVLELSRDMNDMAANCILTGVEVGKKIAPKRNAYKRHAENRAMKAEVFKWLDDNFANFKSMDSAAEAMAGKLIPATFRTVRAWVTEWKKLRSASRP